MIVKVYRLPFSTVLYCSKGDYTTSVDIAKFATFTAISSKKAKLPSLYYCAVAQNYASHSAGRAALAKQQHCLSLVFCSSTHTQWSVLQLHRQCMQMRASLAVKDQRAIEASPHPQ
jgi:hypothetical protein